MSTTDKELGYLCVDWRGIVVGRRLRVVVKSCGRFPADRKSWSCGPLIARACCLIIGDKIHLRTLILVLVFAYTKQGCTIYP
jgi:hypothetical protein